MTRAVTAEAELKQLKGQTAKELQDVKDELVDRLEQAQATAEQRLERHTEEYRLQVRCCMMTDRERNEHGGDSTWAILGREPVLLPCSVCRYAHSGAALLHDQNIRKAQGRQLR